MELFTKTVYKGPSVLPAGALSLEHLCAISVMVSHGDSHLTWYSAWVPTQT